MPKVGSLLCDDHELIVHSLIQGELLHRQEHDSHRRHEGGPTIRRLLHSADPQVRGAEPWSEGHQDVEVETRTDVFLLFPLKAK